MKVKYYNTNLLPVLLPDNTIQNGGVSAWQGIRYIAEDTYILCGTTNPNPNQGNGLLYLGNISCSNGKQYYLNVPQNNETSFLTSVYGPNYDFNTGNFTFVGSFTNEEGKISGFCYNGKLNEIELMNKNNFSFPQEINLKYDISFLHSNMNNLIVGNSGKSKQNPTELISYIIDQKTMKIKEYIQFPNTGTTTSYGIWYNGNNCYTIVGGYSKNKVGISKIYKSGLPVPYESGFIVDYNSKTNKFCNWTSINYKNSKNFVTHFEGIYKLEGTNMYALNADVINNNLSTSSGYYLTLCRCKNKFKVNRWTEIKYPSNTPGFTSSNSVANNNVVGLFVSPDGKNNVSYQASII
jgi:hypothetical protein